MSLVVIDAAGSPREMGQAHGEQARELIARSLSDWNEAMAGLGHEPESLINALSRESGLSSALESHLPWLSEEIGGIAEGSNLTVDQIFALNCLDEAWWWGEKSPGCSVIGLGGRVDEALCGQTMDLDPWMDGTQIALRLAPDDAPAQVLLSRAGMIGLCGVNEAGVAVLVNTLSQLPVSPDGVFVAGALRAAIASKSVDDAFAALTSFPHASGQAYTLVSDDVARGLECGAGVAQEYVNDHQRPNQRWHTNHPLAATGETDDLGVSSPVRMAALDERAPSIESLDDLKAVLTDGDSGICMYPGRWPDGSQTFGTLAISLGGTPEVQLAPGPADRTPWHQVSFLTR